MRTIDLQILRAGITVTTIKVDDTAVYSRQLMGEHRITVEFTVPQPVDIQISDYIVWRGNNFYVNIAPNVVRVSKNRLEYSVIFEALDYSLYNKIMKDEGDSRFSYFGTPEDHLLLLVENLNVYDTGWTVGNVEDIAPTTVQYEDITCREALLNMANTFGLEYVIEGKFISLLKRFEIPSNVNLSYGKGNGLYQLERQRVEDRGVITRLDVWGGSKNLPLDYRGGLRALTIEDRFITQNTALYGIREGVVRFENIFPSRTGIINGINEGDPGEIIDSSLDFDINAYRMEGTVAKIVFKSGALAGYEFDILEYNHSLKRIRFRSFNDAGTILPSETSRPEIGDTYTIVDITMPQSYINQAEADLLEAAEEFLAVRSFPAVTYSFDCDEKYIRDNNVAIVFGQKIRVIDNDLDLDVNLRVTGISYPLSVPSRITATISEEVTFTVQDRLQKQVVENIYEIIRVEREANKNAVVQAEQIVRSGTDGYIPRFRDVENRKELVDSSIREVTVGGTKAIEIGEIVNGLWVPRPIYASNFIKNGNGGSGGSGGPGGLITWDNIVSKPENFPTIWSLVGSKPETATRWPSWAEVTNKPVTFAPSLHSLVSHSDVSVTSPTNVQYLGWNGTSWINRTVSWNELSNRPSIPTISGTIGRIPVFTGSSAISDSIMRQDGTQIIIEGDLVVNGYSFSQNFIKNGSGGSGGGGTSGPVTWDNILNKPDNFPTTWSLVANKPDTATRWPTWVEVTGKPTAFTPVSHSHVISDITALQSELNTRALITRTITAGTWLSGGGTLAGDRTLNVVIGVNSYLNDTNGAPRLYIGDSSQATNQFIFRAARDDAGQFQIRNASNATTWAINVVTGTLATGSVPWARLTDLPSLITGTGTAGQIPFWNGSVTQSGDSGLTWNNTNKKMIIGTSGTSIARHEIELYGATGGLIRLWSGTVNEGIIYSQTGQTNVRHITTGNLNFWTDNLIRWSVLPAGILQSNGSQTIRTSTGDLILTSLGGNGNININPHGTGSAIVGGSANPSFFVTANTGAGGQGNPSINLNRSTLTGLRMEYVPGLEGRISATAAATGFLTFYTGAGNERMRITSSGSVLINTSSELPGGGMFQVNGVIRSNSAIHGTNFIKSSDRRLKTDILPITNWRKALEYIKGYNYIKSGEREFGFIAQDVKDVLPDLVKTDMKGYLSMDYNGMIPVLWEAVKEEMSEIERLKRRVSDLENEVSKLKNAA